MKLALQYVTDAYGDPLFVQLSIADWEKIVKKLKRYEKALGIEEDDLVNTGRKIRAKIKTPPLEEITKEVEIVRTRQYKRTK